MAERRVRIELHAQAKDLAGTAEAGVDVTESATGTDLKRALAESHPRLAGLLEHAALATDEEYVADAAPLGDRTSFHLIPPVSGG